MQLDPNKKPIPPPPGPPPGGGESGVEGTIENTVEEATQAALTHLQNASTQPRQPLSSRSVVQTPTVIPRGIIQLKEHLEKEIVNLQLPYGKAVLERLDKLPPRLYLFFQQGMSKTPKNLSLIQKVDTVLNLCDVAIMMKFKPDSSFSLDEFIPPRFQREILEIDFFKLRDFSKAETSPEEALEIRECMGNIIKIAHETARSISDDIFAEFLRRFNGDMKEFPLFRDAYICLFSMIASKEIPIDEKLAFNIIGRGYFGDISDKMFLFLADLKLGNETYKILKKEGFANIKQDEKEKYSSGRSRAKGFLREEDKKKLENENLKIKRILTNPYTNLATKFDEIMNFNNLSENIANLKDHLSIFTEEQRFAIAQNIYGLSPLKDILDSLQLSFENKLKITLDKIKKSPQDIDPQPIVEHIINDPKITKETFKQILNLFPVLSGEKFLKLFDKDLFSGPKAIFTHAEMLDLLKEIGIKKVMCFGTLSYPFLETMQITKEEFMQLIAHQMSVYPQFDIFRRLADIKKSGEDEGIYKLTPTEKLNLVKQSLRGFKSQMEEKFVGQNSHNAYENEGLDEYFQHLMGEIPLEFKKVDPNIFELIATKPPHELDPKVIQKANEIMDALTLHACYTPNAPLLEVPAIAKDFIIKQRPLLALYLYPESFVTSSPEVIRSTFPPRIADLLLEDPPHKSSFMWLGSLALRLEFENISLDDVTQGLFSGVLKMRNPPERYKLRDFIFLTAIYGKKSFTPQLSAFQNQFGKRHNIIYGLILSTFYSGDINKLAAISPIQEAKESKAVYSGLIALMKVNADPEPKSELLLNMLGSGKVNIKLFAEEMSLLPHLIMIEELDLSERTKQGPGSIKKCLIYMLEVNMGVKISKYPQFSNLENLYQTVFADPDKIRNPSALFIFAAKINSLKDEKLSNAFEGFIDSIIKGTFRELRYNDDNQPHLKNIFKDEKLKKEWMKGEKVPLDQFIKSYSSQITATAKDIDPYTFFREKLIEGHLILSDYPGLRIFADSLKSNVHSEETRKENLKALSLEKPTNPEILKQLNLSIALIKLYGLKGKEEQLAFFDKEINPLIDQVFKGPNAPQFKADLLFLRNNLGVKKEFASLEGFTIEDSDNWQDLLLCGTEILGSCQDVNGDPNLMKCLLGYILGGEVRLILIRHPSGAIVGRRLVRLLSGEKSSTEVLYSERLYKDLRCTSEMERAIDYMLVQRAKAMGRDLVTDGQRSEKVSTVPYTEGIKSLSTRAPFMYVDAPKNKEGDPHGVVPSGEYAIPAEMLTLLFSPPKVS